MAAPIVTVLSPPGERRGPEALEFPGCHPVRISREEMDTIDEVHDGEVRFEYWDGDTETAMICDPPVSYYHELPASRLARLADRITAARGAPIEAVGHTDLVVRNARGERQRIVQADQILFLLPAQAIPAGNAIEVGTDALPEVVLEVVLEVDNTTDVRRGKLRLYEWRVTTKRTSCVGCRPPERAECLRVSHTRSACAESVGFHEQCGR